MESSADRAIAIVGVGAILPDAPSAAAFWSNIINKRYSISEVPPERWSVEDYYDEDIKAPDKTYTKIGGWVRGFEFDWKRFRMPPKVAAAMDQGQQWAVTIAADALADYGYPERPLDTERTAVILGTAMGGELHYLTHTRIVFPEFARALQSVADFKQLPQATRETILSHWHEVIDQAIPPVTEDTMPGELPNIVSGRVANMLNLRGPNFITDAACASSFAALNAAVELLVQHEVDAVITGGIDRNMSVSTFVKFCKIGALSATGSRPFGTGADGFVMGEGSGAFLLKRLSDAERAGDKIYAVIRGVGGASDGKGKGITAPNPVGQRLAMKRAWESAGLNPATATMVEAHGTSTRVGDVVEVESLAEVFSEAPRNGIALGSAKGNIGHLKAGAGAAGLLKAALALYHKILPPTLNADPPNENIAFNQTPFYLNHEAHEWEMPNGDPRRCGVSAYGFGGTNFHIVIEEHLPGSLSSQGRSYPGASLANQPSNGGRAGSATGSGAPSTPSSSAPMNQVATPSGSNGSHITVQATAPLRGVLAIGANTPKELQEKVEDIVRRVEAGWTPSQALPRPADLLARERLLIDFADHDELLDRLHKTQKAIGFDTRQAWNAFRAQGIFRGSGHKPGKIAFLFPGQGSQYVNMGRDLAEVAPVVKEVFDLADEVMTPILGRPLTDYIFVDPDDKAAVSKAELDLMQTAITQPAVLTLDMALLKLLETHGFQPDMVMGHSLGEYAALIAAGIMRFEDALEAAAARGSEMSKVSVEDNGWMAAVLAPLEEVQAILAQIDGYVVPANINSHTQCVIGGESKAVEQALKIFEERDYRAMQLPVSHAFHTRIVAPASAPLRQVLDRLDIREPGLPLVANVTGELYPTTVPEIKDILQQQIASPVQWVKGLETLYDEGVRTFVEVGPKRALKSFVDDVLGDREDVVSLLTAHPKTGEIPTFNQALCGLYAAGYAIEAARAEQQRAIPTPVPVSRPAASPQPEVKLQEVPENNKPAMTNYNQQGDDSVSISINALSQAMAQALQQTAGHLTQSTGTARQYDRNAPPQGSVVISGTGLGLPGAEKPVMDPDNAMRILRGEQFVDLIPERFRKKMINKRVTRLVKSADGSGHFETINDPSEVIKLAGRPGPFDLHEEYGVPKKLIDALDSTTQLAMAAGLESLREAGIPLVQTYRRTSTGKLLPDVWKLPESMRDETGVIFASAFPGGGRFAEAMEEYFTYQGRVDKIEMLQDMRRYVTDPIALSEINRRIAEVREELEREAYEFDRRFLFRVLAMGHSQFAQYIGARGPNTHINAACASTAQGIAIAEDWIRAGRCRRVIVIGADNVTSDNLMEWIGAGFLATGAAATDDNVAEAALPFDRRRHGTLLGMGACAVVVESEDAMRERGMRGIVEVLTTETRNSAFHGTRLDVSHISDVMEELVSAAERRFNTNRHAMAPQLVFMSHETYTPARGGSAAAEVAALRHTFGESAKDVIVSNTKGFTGHPMGVGIEDVIAIKILEHGIVPPVPNYKEVDPDLGQLNLSRGGRYPVQYALHLSAGFGSQIAMTLVRRISGNLDRIDDKVRYQNWLNAVSGYSSAETEFVKRVLRVKPPEVLEEVRPAASTWRYGTGPIQRVQMPDNGYILSGTPVPAQPSTDYEPVPVPVSASPAPQPATPVQPAPAPVRPVSHRVSTPTRVDGGQQSEIVAQRSAPAAVAAPAPMQEAVDPVTSKVLAIVAEQTGYPEDMLDLDLDLEADLGVDTVKQAETFAAIRETFDIPRNDNLKLRDYPTLEHVIQFVRDSRPDLTAVAPSPAASDEVGVSPQPTATPITATDPVTDKVLAIVADQTGYPEDMLDLDLDLEADLGVDTVKQAETFAAIRETFDIPRNDDLKLRDYPTLEHVIQFVRDSRPDLAPDGAATALATALASSPVAPATFVPTTDTIAEKVLAIVAEQTGYPEDMLEFDLDLEADLGVDTVKQAETFAAIRETFDIPRNDDLKLRDYPTLGHVIQFVRDSRPDLAPSQAAAPASTPEAPAAPALTDDSVTEKVLGIVAEQTGYPEDMLELDLDLEADLGVDTVKQAETFAAIRETFDIPRNDDLKLRDYPTLGHVIQFVHDSRPDLAPSQAAAPASTSEALAPAAPAPTGDPVTEKVLGIVAEQTGYPEDMLEFDLDLEADLGVDTVKQAETFAAIRETFDIPRNDDLKLRDYPTLGHVIQFVHDSRPDLASGAAVAISATSSETVSSTETQMAALAGTIEDADRIPRRVPVPSLRPELDLCKPSGVTLDENSRVLVMLDSGGVGSSLVSRLEKRGVEVLVLNAETATEELETQLNEWLEAGSVQGVYWLPALDAEAELEELDFADWHELNRQRTKNLYTTMHLLYESVSGTNNFLVSATRLGGLHGYGDEGATAPLGGAVSGFTKAYKREQGDVLVKVVDFEVSRKTAALADMLIDETLTDPGVVEIGYLDEKRYAVTLVEKPAADGQPGLELTNETVFVVTGAAGGITSAIVTDLALASGGIFYLLDLVEAPDAEDTKVQLFRKDNDALKRQLIEEAKAAGERPTPVEIDKQMMALERQEAALRAVESVEAANGTAYYRSLNLLDHEAVTTVVDEIRERHGRIDVLVHAGGLEISRPLPKKDFKQFSLVFDVKADGFFSLLKAAAGMPIGATVAFSSVAGRFGNSGQTDYSAANDLLCKISSSMRRWRPETRAIVIDWTAWGGIGMATRGSIPKIMEMAGIDMLPPESGIPTVRRELTAGAFRGEIVVGNQLGILVEEWDETGGLDLEKANQQLAERESPLLMVGEIKSASLYGGVEVQTILDPNEQAFLYDHQMDDTPLLPGVMGTEAFAQLASLIAPGYHVAAVENESFEAPFKFYRMEPQTLHLSARIEPGPGGDLVAYTVLRSVRELAKPGMPPQEKIHFTAEVRLTPDALESPEVDFTPPAADALSIKANDIYQIYFHGPAYQVLEGVQVEGRTAIGLMAGNLPPNTSPENATSLMAPRLIELCFQTAGVWEIHTKGRMALPMAIESVAAYRQPDEASGERLYAQVEALDDGTRFNAVVVDSTGRVYVRLTGYRTVQLPGDVSL